MNTSHRTLITAIVATAVAVAAPGGSIGAGALSSTAADAVDDDQLAAAVQEIIDASLEPGAIDWNCCGVDLPPTGVIVGLRVPGRADMLLSAGTYLDGTALDSHASFSTANLGYSIVAEIGLKLVAAGTLDPDDTIDAWLPDAPNADRVTVQMLIDTTTGWGDYGEVMGQNVLADVERHWTSGEAAATLADVAPVGEPGTFVTGLVGAVGSGMLALGYIAEQVTGRSLADLVTSEIAEPAGLEHSFFSDGTDLPDNFQYGRFFVEELSMHSTAEVPLTAYFTYAPAEAAFVSTVPDLLDLLDTWVDGTWRPGAPPTPAAFPADRELDPEYVGDPPRYLGLDVPYSGYCPCQATSDGNAVDAIGRRPATFGTDVHLFYYPDDDISIVLHYNSNTWPQRSQIEAVLADIRATVAAST